MSDCVYVAWTEAARELGVEPKEDSRPFFELARSLVGESQGLWAGAAPAVLGLLCRMHCLTLTVSCHPWFDEEYYSAAAMSQWQHWAVDLWRNEPFWRGVGLPPEEEGQASQGSIYFWLGGHHAYYAVEKTPEHLVIMTINIYRKEES